MTRNCLPTARSALALAALAVMASSPAVAQSDDTAELETVEVIGSRIRNADLVDQVPVQTISSEDIEKSGIKSIGELLQKMSTAGSSINTKFNSAGNFGFPADGGGVGSGSTTVALRNLDPRRTLVLVDGMRWINESSASGVASYVDLNSIPIAAIERVEVLTDGASSLYGSDAIAGVVNVVTKKDADGVTLDLYGGDYSTGDGTTKTASLSFGSSVGKMRFFTDFSYYEQDPISSAEWDQSFYPTPGLGLSAGSSGIPTTRSVFYSPTDYGGLCDADGEAFICDITANGTAANGSVPVVPDEFHRFVGSEDRFNFAPYNMLLTPSERKSVFSQIQYDLKPNVTLYARGMYQNRESVNQAAPEPIFIGPDNSGLAALVTVDATNPYNPFGYTLDSSNFIFAGRRPLEGGPRIFTQDVDTFYVAGGVKGFFEFGPGRYDWDVNLLSGNNRAQQTVQGTYNLEHIRRALGPVDLCTGACVPLNFFGGPGTITPEMLDYIRYVERDSSEQKLNGWSVNVTGPVLSLPAGTLSIAAGYEGRHLSGEYLPDSVVVNGEGNGVPSTPTSGSDSVDEFYGELSIPLLAGMPGVQALDASLAVRYSDYESFGDTTNWKYGLRWQPLVDLTVRGTYAEGFRAPSIGELYATGARFDATLTDPCNFATGTTAANCETLGVPDPETFEQSNTQIGVDTGGNPTLQPETSDSYTAGFVYSPRWAEHLAWSSAMNLEVTWYYIKLENAIQATDAQVRLDRCVQTLDPAYCEGITRSATGNIIQYENGLLNLGTIKTSGLDATLSWASPGFDFGKFGATLAATYIAKYESISNDTGAQEPKVVGRELNDTGIPRVKGSLRLDYAVAGVVANWTMRYIGEMTEDCGDAVGATTCSNSDEGYNKLGATWYHDLRLAYSTTLADYDITLAGGVNNVLDNDPPVCVSCSLNGYDASNYDLPGRFSYVQATLHY